MKSASPPPISIRNLQRSVLTPIRELQAFAGAACKLVWRSRRAKSEITFCSHIEVVIVSDSRMAALHKKFCGVRGATDVLTFQHGEIVVSAETAARQARTFATDYSAEIQLYLLHGLLHLAGFDDATPSGRREMERTQKKLMRTIRGTSNNL